MPPLANVNNALKISLEFDIAGAAGGVRFWQAYSSAGVPSAPDLTTYAGQVRSAFSAHLAALMNPAYSLTSTTAQDMASSSGNVGTDLTAVAGTRSGSDIDAETCVVLNFKINEHFRGGRPRCFLPFGNNGDLASVTEWAGSFLTAVDSGWTSFQTAINSLTETSFTSGSQGVPLLYKGYILPPITLPSGFVKNRPKPVAGPVDLQPVIGHAARAIVGSQRRRLLT